MSGTLYLGTSGYAYDEWKGSFYPEGLKIKERLPYYASVFNSVEINYTFRRFPAETTLTSWVEQTPDGFHFTLKANQRITHKLKLRDAGEDVQSFLERADTLGDRRGAVLFQCPPYLRFDRELIDGFLATLRPDGRYAMEFRHRSWDEARPILADAGVAWCTAETDEDETAPAVPDWAPFGYLRLRKTAYGDDELKAWADRVGPALAEDRDVFCYFKHEEHGDAPGFALALRKHLGLG